MTESWRFRFHTWVLFAATLWLVAIFSPALVWKLGSSLGAIAYIFFSSVCHQLPERSFHLWGIQLAVCHRCLGLYGGFWLGLLVLPFCGSLRRSLLTRPRWLIVFALPLLINVLTPNSAVDRFLTGIVAGFPVAVFVQVAVEQLKWTVRGGINEPGRAR